VIPAGTVATRTEPSSDASATDKSRALERRRAIREEIKTLEPTHAWAGEYSEFHVDGGLRVAVAPREGYAVTEFGADGERVIAWGRVRVEGEFLRLSAEFPSVGQWSAPTSLIPVRWGERRYLLFENGLVDFCNDVNSGREASHPFQEHLGINHEGKVTGKPQVPVAYRGMLFDEPLKARVARAWDEGGARHVEFDIGSDQGAFERMRLYASIDWAFQMSVIDVQPTTCKGLAFTDERYFYLLEVGSEFSTLCPER
jgi:hypothetical protein